ncbi:hypothetical protein EDM80_13610 [bacterium]|nr:MAG: hypothetical protein EDM80_13610 [bacterium]RIK62612.1 MAG: hypothetical protein DCC64_09985 [Planctomycetota bacterium]
MTTVYLIRHAEALAREAWSEDDRDRPLTEKGQKQAFQLAQHLRKSGIGEVRTSPAQRCRETVVPLATALGVELLVDNDLYEGGGALKLPAGEGVYALCSHGDKIPATLDALGIKWEKCKKGSIWKLELAKSGKVLRAEYIPPLS